MALSCNRRAFELDEGCPSVDIDLTFPDFDACGDANEGRLKGVSRIALQKSPAFPTFMPGADPLPVSIPDVSVIIENACPFDQEAFDDTPGVYESAKPDTKPSVMVSLDGSSNSCGVSGIKVRIVVPDLSAKLGTSSVPSGEKIYDTVTGEEADNDSWHVAVPALGLVGAMGSASVYE